MKNKNIIIIIVLFIISFFAVLWIKSSGQPGELDQFAECLGKNGAVFYGTFWCSHCQNQKALFGKSAKRLPYVECSTPDGQRQSAFCKDKNIESYPTWEFNDGSRLSGEISLTQLAEKTGCPLPQ
ncbi:MAG: thioredoxin domain-containing protein [Patescibacteria group bacterium]